MTTYFVDSSVKKSGDGLTWQTAFKSANEAWDIMERNAPQNVEVVDDTDTTQDRGAQGVD